MMPTWTPPAIDKQNRPRGPRSTCCNGHVKVWTNGRWMLWHGYGAPPGIVACATCDRRLTALMAFDWWEDTPFTLPECSPALDVLRGQHRTAVLQAVCKMCHLSNAAGRKV